MTSDTRSFQKDEIIQTEGSPPLAHAYVSRHFNARAKSHADFGPPESFWFGRLRKGLL
jgi:hypothetical protein